MGHAVRRRAHAKLNLDLRVWPPEPAGSERPGWHRIASWMACIDLGDEVVVELGGTSLELIRSWAPDAPRPVPFDWPADRDLAWRAVRALEARVGRDLPCRVSLTKRTPTGGGLGGGSSDAAAVLLACNEAFDLGLSVHELRGIGHTLGSDVPFFIDDSSPPPPALVQGFGEVLVRGARLASDVTLILPRVGCATPEVYRTFDQTHPATPRAGDLAALAQAAAAGRIDEQVLQNDLSTAARQVAPEVGEVWARAAAALPGRLVRMSGSGSTLWLLGGLGVHESDRVRRALAGRADVVSSRLV